MRARRGGWLPVWGIAFVVGQVMTGCARQAPVETVELRRLPLDDMQGILTRSGVEVDTAVSADGRGSLKIATSQPTTVRLFELKDLGVDDTRLVYQAKVRTEGVTGKVYLEMWCHFPGKGEFFSRALDQPLSGTVEWTTQETPFFLQKGEKPDIVKLNLVIDGQGTAWIDDVRVLKGPLQ